jgi:hypothetical protein
MQQAVRHDIIKNEPSSQSQSEMKDFLRYMKPSMIYKIHIYQYTKVLKQVSIFRNRDQEIEYALRLIKIGFYEPE